MSQGRLVWYLLAIVLLALGVLFGFAWQSGELFHQKSSSQAYALPVGTDCVILDMQVFDSSNVASNPFAGKNAILTVDGVTYQCWISGELKVARR